LKLFIAALPQIFRKICQAHHNNGQSRDVRDVNPSGEYSCNDNGHKKANHRSDYKHLNLIQWLFLLMAGDLLNGSVVKMFCLIGFAYKKG
jgi:hypothetical protein